MNIPAQLKYTTDHEWVRIEGDMAFIGITDYAQGELGEIVYVDVPTEGETVAAGEVFGSIEAVKTVADLLMPIEGEVVELNAALEDQPELVNNDPYGEGWIIKVKMADPAKVETLMDAAAYSSFLG
ncbi:glycine cleavage system protein GcvH [Porphyromonas endodontalis]|uniref:glycine cleavage system protein GcvH n=1 Tax=Porphyromonas endodontalis TaxID=28124 RepID=UPI0023F554D8|nr:glycine cleavage system protein GcvH [Porphyromonas endodontalis]